MGALLGEGIINLNARAIDIKNRFGKLNKKQRARINYYNLCNTVKYLIGQLGYDSDDVFKERCIIKDITDIGDVRLYNTIQMYWTFVQIDTRILNGDTYSFDLALKRNNWSMVDKAELLYMITISKYGYYIDLNGANLSSLDNKEIEKALDKMEEFINEVENKKAGVL